MVEIQTGEFSNRKHVGAWKIVEYRSRSIYVKQLARRVSLCQSTDIFTSSAGRIFLSVPK